MVIWLTDSSPRTSLIYSDCHYSHNGQFFVTVTWLGMEWRRNVHNLLCWASTSSKQSITAPGHPCIPAIGYHCPTASLHPCYRVPLPHSITAPLPQGITTPQHHCPMPWHHGITACPSPWLLIYYTPCLGQRRCICLKRPSFLLACCFLGFVFWGQTLLINATFTIELNIKEHRSLLFHGARWNAELISSSP